MEMFSTGAPDDAQIRAAFDTLAEELCAPFDKPGLRNKMQQEASEKLEALPYATA